jgi:DNA (cytosine-5)-methyltransferase 1
MKPPTFLIVDLFCGFGGTTTGFANAIVNGSKIAKIIACVNHDSKAIKSHWLNHPEVTHFEEDIRTLDLRELKALVEYWRCIYPEAYLLLWASLECTNFSKAKGGQPRNADSRTLAEHIFRYVEAINPDYLQIENVVEFMSWGPLDENGKPISRKNGQDFMRWRNQMCRYGYKDEWRELNSADFGAYTSRNRLFGCFAKNGLPIVWPQATHSKKANTGMFGNLEKWKPVKEVLNFEDEGESIFSRKKPLSVKTLERIYAGLVKFIAKGDNSFLSNYKSGHPSSKNTSLETVAGTLTTVPTQAVIQTKFLLKYNSINGKTGVHHPPSIEEPAPVVSCQARLGLVQPEFLTHFYGNGFNTSLNQPCPTLTTKERVALVDTKFILNPSHGGHCTSQNSPCPVIVARQDKAPLYVVNANTGAFEILIYETDSAIAIKIKQFMVAFGIADIKMRMLRVTELLKIQGFPENYKMEGTQTDHKKFIGNSVVPHVVKAWAEAMGIVLINKRIKFA